jgi:oxygen-independent coproporphyrinogen-3 oxidase
VTPRIEDFAPTGPIGVYVHIPFCSTKCDYCGFFSLCPPDVETAEAVVSDALSDLADLHARLGRPPVRTVYIGGGTPSVLPAGLIDRLGRGIVRIAGGGIEEWTVEANPESLTPERRAVLSDLPVTRVSVGVQSFSSSARERIGRRVSSGAIDRALELLAAGPWSVGVDLIAGIPGVDTAEQLRDVERAVAAGAAHVGLYTLTVETGTPLARRVGAGEVRLPREERVASAVDAARTRLAEAGLIRYEVSNYAVPGRECRHNDGYWLLEPYIGVGPSAVSTLPGPDGTALRLRVPQTEAAPGGAGRRRGGIGGTRGSGAPAGGEGLQVEHVGRQSFILEHFMMGLRRREGLPAALLSRRFAARPEELIPRTLRGWEAAGLLVRAREGETTDAIRMTDAGMWYLDALLAEIARERASA